MKLEYQSSNGVYTLQCTYDERAVPKGAGFKWDSEARTWWTSSSIAAGRLARYADEMAQEKLSSAKGNVAASYAETSDLDVPCPDGLSFYPFQLAGIEFMNKRDAVLLADAMGCIDGEAEIIINRGGNSRRYKLADIFQRFNLLSSRRKNWSRAIPTRTASLIDGELRLNTIKGVLYSGKKTVMSVLLSSGKKLRLTPDHRVITNRNEWCEIQTLQVGAKILTNGTQLCTICGSPDNIITTPYAKFRGICKSCMYRHKRKNSIKTEGQVLDKDGYVRIPQNYYHPRRNTAGQVLEHILVMEAHLGRFIERNEQIHHINGDRGDNRIQNLALVTDSEHKKLHNAHLRLGMFVPKEDEIISITLEPEQIDTYDIVMFEPGRSFVANGIIVHNCGKTIQVVGLINLDESITSVLVICPAIAKHLWKAEIEKWCTREMTVGIANGKAFPTTDIVIVNYDIIHNFKKELRARDWSLRVCDEAHRLKNVKTRRCQNVLGKWNGRAHQWDIPPIPGKKRLMLTGTPIVNRPIELWALIRALDPSTWCDWHYFTQRYCRARKTRWGLDTSGSSNMQELGLKLRSTIMIRRAKKDVLKDLPLKTRQVIEIPADSVTAKVIDKQTVEYGLRVDKILDLEKAVDTAEKTRNEERYAELVDKLREARKIAFADMSALRLETAKVKVPIVIKHLEDLLENEQKVVVFVHHKVMAEALHEQFKDISVVVTGEVSPAQRFERVKQFQEDPKILLFIGNIQAAGVAITLTASSHCVFAELSWTPGDLTQCEDRLLRIGQKNAVQIQHIVYEGSIDAKMCRTIVQKQNAIDKIMSDKK